MPIEPTDIKVLLVHFLVEPNGEISLYIYIVAECPSHRAGMCEAFATFHPLEQL